MKKLAPRSGDVTLWSGREGPGVGGHRRPVGAEDAVRELRRVGGIRRQGGARGQRSPCWSPGRRRRWPRSASRRWGPAWAARDAAARLGLRPSPGAPGQGINHLGAADPPLLIGRRAAGTIAERPDLHGRREDHFRTALRHDPGRSSECGEREALPLRVVHTHHDALFAILVPDAREHETVVIAETLPQPALELGLAVEENGAVEAIIAVAANGVVGQKREYVAKPATVPCT